MRKKAVQALDSRLSTMIENAYYYCNPPDRQKVIIPPLYLVTKQKRLKEFSSTVYDQR